MGEFTCPHSDCTGSEDVFETERAMKIHYGTVHDGSIAKKKSICSVDGCKSEFAYYPSNKSGKFCEDCTESMNYHLTSEDIKYVLINCKNCNTELTKTKIQWERYDNHFCGNECRYEDARHKQTCQNCRGTYYAADWKVERGRKYCSFECFTI